LPGRKLTTRSRLFYFMTYSKKLQDPRWQKKRLEILERDDFKCQNCSDTKNTLHVHHKIYSGEPWETESKYLITLCEDCHSKEEVLIREFKQNIHEWIANSPVKIGCLNRFFKNIEKINIQCDEDKLFMAFFMAMCNVNFQTALMSIYEIYFDGYGECEENYKEKDVLPF
jgi:hypothetical protein